MPRKWVQRMRNYQWIPSLPFNLKPILDITDTLMSKPNDPNPLRLPTDIKYISIHHSAVEGATIESYAKYHVKNQGWFHIGYHTVIKGDQTYQTNDLLTFSYHTASHNAQTVSVSISGDLSKRPLSEVERNNLYGVILTYMELFGIPVENVKGHNEFPDQKTSCPCIDMNKVRMDIAGLQFQMKALPNVKDISFKNVNQHIFLYNQYKADPEKQKWLEPYLLKMHKITDEMGMYFNK
jgi:hypothetical protein